MDRRDLTARVMADMDPDLFDFLKTYVDSFVKWDLLHFFYENPNTIDTVESIARYAGRASEDVEPELEQLTRRGLLVETSLGDMTVYALRADPGLRIRLEQFIKATRDREFRRKAIYHLIRR